jgi:hypothetical protein
MHRRELAVRDYSIRVLAQTVGVVGKDVQTTGPAIASAVQEASGALARRDCAGVSVGIVVEGHRFLNRQLRRPPSELSWVAARAPRLANRG